MKKDELNKLHTQTTEPKEVKSKILSRIQQQLTRKEGEESMTYLKYDEHNKVNQYSRVRCRPFRCPSNSLCCRLRPSGIPKLNPEFRTNL